MVGTIVGGHRLYIGMTGVLGNETNSELFFDTRISASKVGECHVSSHQSSYPLSMKF